MIEIFLAEGRLVSALQLGDCFLPSKVVGFAIFFCPVTRRDSMISFFLLENFVFLTIFLVIVRANGLVDSVSARKFFEAADKTGDKRVFFTVFRLDFEK